MKKKIMYFTTMIFMTICLMGCNGEKKATEVDLNGNAYLAETSSGEIVINCDDEGNPVEIIDANGEVIDLTEEDVKVERDENGEIVSVTVADQSVTVKEKATEGKIEKILATTQETRKKKEAEIQGKKPEEKKAVEGPNTFVEPSERSSEKKEENEIKEVEIFPLGNVPEKVLEKAEEKKMEEEKPSEESSEIPSERQDENFFEPTNEKNEPLVPTPEIMEQFAKERAEEVEKENERRRLEGNNWPISASANRAVFDEINAYRVENGLEPLAWGAVDMEEIGSIRAYEQTELVINKLQEMSHAYGTPWNGLENLCGGGKSEGAFESWRTSPGHNMTMLRPELKECVVYTGYYEVTDRGIYTGVYVALFR